ncbi:MAG: hypothetical protein GWM90_02300 [Gemmatimonadetes bacterium]|nr:hypothetical protein [Gemmatimonadota bacterium]NIQ52458.1 hypothetical protein [Gemmatimonadota bacterium]NIU72591.1 hypothetical protein [Gammaproteobacteria bacterium]NIX43000.1 hypothetical protein [Gemmatimonadota bacterium]NIY07175.1 hypothetical protein [Gemmatimonadota bacterium]
MKTDRAGGRWARWLASGLLALSAGCGDGDGVAGPTVDLDLVAGLYEIQTLTFDPQGSAPAADVLSALEAAGTSPTLNIGRTGNFQLFFRDPVSGDIRTVDGDVEGTAEGVELAFATRADAALFLFPQRLPLAFDGEAGTLFYSGPAEVNRARLQLLFPELYADEQLFDPTPGVLTAGFQRLEEASGG